LPRLQPVHAVTEELLNDGCVFPADNYVTPHQLNANLDDLYVAPQAVVPVIKRRHLNMIHNRRSHYTATTTTTTCASAAVAAVPCTARGAEAKPTVRRRLNFGVSALPEAPVAERQEKSSKLSNKSASASEQAPAPEDHFKKEGRGPDKDNPGGWGAFLGSTFGGSF
ncbi:MAG: hypothetical protein B7X06_00215, partial [Verrucomicrobia bacterium 21-51-4]